MRRLQTLRLDQGPTYLVDQDDEIRDLTAVVREILSSYGKVGIWPEWRRRTRG